MNTFSPSSALVTGASGFIGGHLARRLIADGWRVTLLARDADRLHGDLRQFCRIVVGDLANSDGLAQAVEDVEVVFHCAANVRTWDTWDAYYRANVLGVENLLDAIASTTAGTVRLVHFSTVDVYGFPEDPCDETCPADGGKFGYGRSKWQGEVLVRKCCEAAAIPYVVLRPANVFGPRGQFVGRIGEALKSGVMLKVSGGRANAGVTYIDNLVEYSIWASRAEVAVGRCYNVRDGYDVTWNEVLERLRQGIGGKGLVIDLPFSIADGIARLIEASCRLFLPGTEPILHRLLVHVFGRTCGHSAASIRIDSGLDGIIGFDEAMDRCIDSFQREIATR